MRIRLSWIGACMIAGAAAAGADDRPAWRGSARDGVSAERDLPERWDPGSGVLWKAALPAAADVMEVEIEGIGILRNRVAASP